MTKYFWFLLIFLSLLIACDSTDFLIDDSNFEPIDIEFEEFIADSTSFYFPDTMDGQGKGGYLFIGDFAGYKTASLIKFNPITTLSQDTIFVDSVVFEFYADKLYYRKNAYQPLPEPTDFTFTLQEYLNDSWRESTVEWKDLNLADNNLNFLQQYEMTTENDSIIFIGDSTYTGTDSSKVNYTTRVKKFRFKFYQILIDKIIKASGGDTLSFLLNTRENTSNFTRGIISAENSTLKDSLGLTETTKYTNFGLPALKVFYHTTNTQNDSLVALSSDDAFVVSAPKDFENKNHFWAVNGSPEIVTTSSVYFDLAKSFDGSPISKTASIVKAEMTLTLDEKLSQRFYYNPDETTKETSARGILSIFKTDAEDSTKTIKLASVVYPEVSSNDSPQITFKYQGGSASDFANLLQTNLGNTKAKILFRNPSDENDLSRYAFYGVSDEVPLEKRPKIKLFFVKQPKSNFE